jgi:hypothetical protein
MGCVTEDEVKDTMEICGCGLAKELCCGDGMSDESLGLLAELRLKAHVDDKALKDFEELVDQSAPPETFWDKLRFWTFDDWKDWLMG